MKHRKFLFVLEYERNGIRNLLPIYEKTIQDAREWVERWETGKHIEVIDLKQWSQFVIHGGAVLPGYIEVPEQMSQQEMLQRFHIELISATKDNPRNHCLLRLMYHCGLRVSEAVSITWKDLVERSEDGQVSVVGKGGKRRYILISSSMWDELVSLGGDVREGYVFRSRKGDTKLTERQVERIILEAAQKAGIKGNVSPHWLRHAHASHSLDRGANINLVRDTLGHASLATTGKYTHARPNASSSQYLPL